MIRPTILVAQLRLVRRAKYGPLRTSRAVIRSALGAQCEVSNRTTAHCRPHGCTEAGFESIWSPRASAAPTTWLSLSVSRARPQHPEDRRSCILTGHCFACGTMLHAVQGRKRLSHMMTQESTKKQSSPELKIPSNTRRVGICGHS